MPYIKSAFNYFAETEKFNNLSLPRKIAVGFLSGLCFFSLIGTIFTPFMWKGTTHLLSKKVKPAKAPKVAAVSTAILKKSHKAESVEPAYLKPAKKSSHSADSRKESHTDTSTTYSSDEPDSDFDILPLLVKLSPEEQIEQLNFASSMEKKLKVLKDSGILVLEEGESFNFEDLGIGDFVLKKSDFGVDLYWKKEDESLGNVFFTNSSIEQKNLVKTLTEIYKLWPFPCGEAQESSVTIQPEAEEISEKPKDHEKEAQIALFERRNLVYPIGTKLRDTLGKGKYALIRTENPDEFIVVYKSNKGIYNKIKMASSAHFRTDVSRFIMNCEKNTGHSNRSKSEKSKKSSIPKEVDHAQDPYSVRTPSGKFVILPIEAGVSLEAGEAKLIRTEDPKIVQLAYRSIEGIASLAKTFVLGPNIEEEVEDYLFRLAKEEEKQLPVDSDDELSGLKEDIHEIEKQITILEEAELKRAIARSEAYEYEQAKLKASAYGSKAVEDGDVASKIERISYLILLPTGIDLENGNYKTIPGSVPDKVMLIYKNQDGIFLAVKKEFSKSKLPEKFAAFRKSIDIPAMRFKIRAEHKRYLNRLEKN